MSRAVVATYSLDLIALLGLVLALGGDEEAEFENSPLGLVKAFDSVRGRLRVIHQVGRILAPRSHRSVLPLLDTMVTAIVSNETDQSWHPKVALVRYDGDNIEWRFWIGSRNLTGSRDLDAGLMLVSSRDKSARVIPDIEELARGLLAEAEFNVSELDELRTARWMAPPGVSVRRVLWRRPGEMRPFITAPLLSRGDRASAVSPFIDGTGLKEVLRAGSQPISILTTEMAASDCAPVKGIAFRTGSAPEPEIPVSVEQQVDDKEAEFTDQPPAGVHAKLLAVSKGSRTALMIGSANFTGRGLLGPNAEAVAILEVTDPILSGSLHDFVQSGFEFDKSRVDEDLAEKEGAQRQLDERISLLLESELSLAYADDGLSLIVGEDADAALASARFEVSPFLDPDTWVGLPSGVRRLRVLQGTVKSSEQTSLVTFRATSLYNPAIQRCWVLSLPVTGLDQECRDRALLARYVGASRFRDWLRSQLDGFDGTAGERWSDGPTPAASGEPSRIPDMFTLETMLSAWARDPKAFERRTAGTMAMLESFRETFEALPDDAERRAALADLTEVQPFLQAVHDAIHGGA
ncbi:phospholipase D family protein [Bosea sp. AS-1]|uniref:phospholipase D family protein n=1 Tax=Bosea sp. AS-1 TaxID=2015316 RepID=UPI000B7981D5|nr:phospholipase D family protein [Bosea sp. AS-1]